VGTPNFIAPEQFNDAKHAGVRCDIYSLGATLYMMVTGEMPFQARGLGGVLKKKLNNEITAPRELAPALSGRVDWAIRRAVKADPAHRYASCREFIQALTHGDAGSGGAAGREPVAGGGRRADAAKPPKGERRASVRYPCSLEIPCKVATSVHADETETQDQWQAVAHDLSVKGLGVILPRRFELGTALTVELQRANKGVARSLDIRVTHLRRAGRGSWFLGCTFTEPLAKEELRKLL
jgi:serine/threonine protein kinase